MDATEVGLKGVVCGCSVDCVHKWKYFPWSS